MVDGESLFVGDSVLCDTDFNSGFVQLYVGFSFLDSRWWHIWRFGFRMSVDVRIIVLPHLHWQFYLIFLLEFLFVGSLRGMSGALDMTVKSPYCLPVKL